MNIEELDEAQGLTAEMVRQWLRQQEPRIKRTTNVMTVTGMGDLWMWPSGDTVRDAKMDAWLSDRVKDIASLEGRTAQSLLREINPRMRPWPSEAAIEAHGMGRWLARDDMGVLLIGYFDLDEEDETTRIFAVDGETPCMGDCEGWTFWPIDAHGNKVRYPERDGVML